MNKVLITLPCYNEELVLEKTVVAVRAYAQKHLADFVCTILILDNNSSDGTRAIADRLATEYPNEVRVTSVSEPGRGVALRVAWAREDGFDIYAYMDTDLATNIKDFRTLVTKVREGYDFVTGSRYIRESDVERNPKREILSRIYNLLLKLILRVSFRDAQCGFKAMSARLVRELVPKTRDAGWFWDTELMILASRGGYRVLEIPVSWREVRDEVRKSKVSHWKESVRQLKNIWEMRRRLKKNYEK